MNKLYLTILQFYVPEVHVAIKQDMEQIRAESDFSIKQYLFPIADRYQELALSAKADLAAKPLPILSNTISQAAIDLIKTMDLDLQKIEQLLYCHETLEHTFIVPSLKIKQTFELNNCLPLMISQTGSLSSLSAITLAKAAIYRQKNVQSQALIVIADKVEFSALRFQFKGFMRGDHVCLLQLSQTKGDYAVIDIQKLNDFTDIPATLQNEANYGRAEQALATLANELLQSALSFHPDIEYVICHQLSPLLCQTVELWCEQASISYLTRKQWQEINLQGSDPYISLKLLEEVKQLSPGRLILLLFASIDFGVGYMVLSKQ